jgi:hypothetical protein
MSSLRDLILVSIAALAVSGCANNTGVYDPHGYLDRRDSIELSAGDANANNIAIQMVDPWPRYAGNKNFAYNGQRAQAAVERYRNNQVIAPRGISASSVYGASGNNNPTPAANNNTPVGQTVAGSSTK